MKRAIDGRWYNTDTSTIVGRYEHENNNDHNVEATLYLNKRGAFFILHQWEVGDAESPRSKYYMEAMAREEVNKLVKDQDNFQIIDEEAWQTPAEVEAEAESGATLYLRLPATLKKRVGSAAAKANLSANSWVIRCLENCLSA